MRKRSAIQSKVITVSPLRRAAIFTLAASVLRRFSKSFSVHRRSLKRSDE
jgi:hypothetical protein